MSSKIFTDPRPCQLAKDSKYGLKFRLNIIYKFSLVTLLLLAVCALAYSGACFASGQYSEFAMSAHKILGFTLAVAVPLHIAINYKKLTKLVSEFTDVITGRAEPSFCNMDRLISALESHTIAQIANELNLDADALFNRLKNSGVRLNSKQQTISEISRLNHEKIFHAIVLIIEAKFNRQKWHEC